MPMDMFQLMEWAAEQVVYIMALDTIQLQQMTDHLHAESNKDLTVEEDLKVIITLGMLSIRIHDLALVQPVIPSGFKDLLQP